MRFNSCPSLLVFLFISFSQHINTKRTGVYMPSKPWGSAVTNLIPQFPCAAQDFSRRNKGKQSRILHKASIHDSTFILIARNRLLKNILVPWDTRWAHLYPGLRGCSTTWMRGHVYVPQNHSFDSACKELQRLSLLSLICLDVEKTQM